MGALPAKYDVLQHCCTACLYDTGLVGLALTYVLTMTTTMAGLIQTFSDVEKQMVFVHVRSVSSTCWRLCKYAITAFYIVAKRLPHAICIHVWLTAS